MLIPLIRQFNGTIGNATAAGAAGARQGLNNAALHAPRAELVLEALKAWPNSPDNVPSHDALVTAVAAIKAALGPHANEHWPDVLDWIMQYDGNSEEYAEKIWTSINNAAVGWEWLASRARGAGFTEDAQEDFAEAPKQHGPVRHRALFLDDLDELPEPSDFIEGLLCDAQCSVFLGAPGAGKSFFTLDLAFHVATGSEWNGREVDRGGVLYIAAEGGGGMKRRVAALRAHMGVEKTAGAAFALLPATVNFRDPASVTGLVQTIADAAERFGTKVRWVIVDTLSRALAGGNENAPDDMGALIRAADHVRTKTGAHLSLIHHSGKDESRGARGHSSLLGAIDTELKIERAEGERDLINVTVTKQRDPAFSTVRTRFAVARRFRVPSVPRQQLEALRSALGLPVAEAVHVHVVEPQARGQVVSRLSARGALLGNWRWLCVPPAVGEFGSEPPR